MWTATVWKPGAVIRAHELSRPQLLERVRRGRTMELRNARYAIRTPPYQWSREPRLRLFPLHRVTP